MHIFFKLKEYFYCIQILQLLNGKPEESTSNTSAVTTKLEIEDEESETNWLNSEIKERLATLLDKTQGWKKLAKHLNFEYLLKILEQSSSSPSLLLLNYIDVCYIYIFFFSNIVYLEL